MESQLKIEEFERQVMWRKRILALQDCVAIGLLAGGIVSAALVVYARLRPLQVPAWILASAVISASLLAAIGFWFFNRAKRREAAFLIDSSLDLEDRVATSRAIIERGEARNEFENALIEDAAAHVSDHKPSEVVAYHISRWSLLSVVGLCALVAALMVPQKVLPKSEDAAAAQAAVQTAGEILESGAAEIEQIVPPETETAELAKQQAELGRALRVSEETRSEALKKLSALEERIRRRHDEIAATRADEIVSLAEQRLNAVLAPKPANRKSEASLDQSNQIKSNPAAQGNEPTTAQSKSPRRNAPDKNKSNEAEQKRAADSNNQQASTNQTARQTESQKQAAEQQNRPQEPASSQSQSPVAQTGKAPGQPSTNQPTPEQSAENNKGDQQQPDQQPPNPLTGAVTEQAAKALPSMSGELMKKAAELRAGQLTPEDIKGLAKAAEYLANDLSKMAQSPEFMAAAEQLARQVTPEMIEQFARELAKNEQLMQELRATGQMLMENQQARQVIAGLANKLEQMGSEMRERAEREGRIPPMDNPRDRRGDTSGRAQQSESGQAGASDKIQGKEVNLSGKLQRKDGGEYLYLPSKAGAGTARAPYSSAYPQYRREAERTVERSRIPPHMRTTVRRYFDAINPDAKKQ